MCSTSLFVGVRVGSPPSIQVVTSCDRVGAGVDGDHHCCSACTVHRLVRPMIKVLNEELRRVIESHFTVCLILNSVVF
jgi:hypothetical protein